MDTNLGFNILSLCIVADLYGTQGKLQFSNIINFKINFHSVMLMEMLPSNYSALFQQLLCGRYCCRADGVDLIYYCTFSNI